MSRFMQFPVCLGLILTAFLRFGLGQTQVDLRTQSKAVDFSAIPNTRPVQVRQDPPAACQVGEYFFKSDAGTGLNTYACVAPSVWALQGDGAGVFVGVGGGQGDPLKVVRTSATRLTVNSDCTPTAPCNLRFGGNSFQYTSSAAVDMAGSETGALKIYVKRDGTLYVGHNLTSNNVTCTGCTKVPSVTAFPSESIPAYSWPVTSGQFDAAQATFDKRAFLSSKTTVAGTGIITSESAGETGVSVNTAVVATFTSGTEAPPASCSPGQTYLKTDANKAYQCTSLNTWLETTESGPLPPSKVKSSQWYAASSGDAGKSQAASGSGWYTPTDDYPAEGSLGTAPWKVTYKIFPDGSNTTTAILAANAPAGWDGGTVDLALRWFGGDGGDNNVVRWLISTVCIGDGVSLLGAGPTFNTAQTVEASGGSSPGGKQQTSSFPSLTLTGCNPGMPLYVKVQRDASHENDTFTDSANLLGMGIDWLLNLQ
jgi:hypothetical protein